MTKGQQAIRDLVKALRDLTGNLPPLPTIFPDTMAPVVQTAPDGVRELTMMRWGFAMAGRGKSGGGRAIYVLVMSGDAAHFEVFRPNL
jgi:putative SOS response-associated peptidase YedK